MRMVESSRFCARVAALVLTAAAVAGCSADASRFKDNLGPMAARPAPSPDVTGSVSGSRVDAQPLPPPPNRPSISSTGVVSGGGGMGSYSPAPAPAPRLVANNAPAHAPAGNGPRARPAPMGGTHVVARGETLHTIGRLYGKSRAEIAKANNIKIDAKLRIGQRIAIPGVAGKPPVKTATAEPLAPPAKPVTAAKPAPAPAQVAKQTPAAPATKVASEPAPAVRLASPATVTPEAAAETTGTTPSFRWPVRGRVIGAFGAKINGQANDGINLSVPEGTSVKAAEDGVVAYSGNELKGYGNLVLVRHSSGFVTAYAHASEVMVKRGDHVKRGQIIARAGQTGGVSSPQLHFEIRKGSTPVDPMQHLSNGT